MPYTNTTSYIIVCSNDDTSNGYVTTSAAKRIDNQTVDLVSGLSGSYYQEQPVDIIVCGWQQWGGFVNGTNTFPIAFPSACYAMAGGGEGDWGGNDISLVSATTSNFVAERETQSTIGKWMALGR